MKVSILKYNAGNIQSVLFALSRLGIEAIVTDNPEELISSDKVIFPGVGEAASAMNYLKERNLDELVKNLKQPVLGICLGMQLMCEHSEEGNTNTLGIFPVKIKKFAVVKDEDLFLKVPQIGWNTVHHLKSQLFNEIKEESYFYFVHGFYAELNSFSIANSTYGIDYCSAIQKDNFYAVQFHPEKSSLVGEKLLSNFIKISK